MNFTTILGIIAVLAGIAILIWPVLLNIVVALTLIVVGAIAIYSGLTKTTTGLA